MSHQPVVYVVQNQHCMDLDGKLVPKFDFAHALEYLPGCPDIATARAGGRLRELLRPSDAPWTPNLYNRLRASLGLFTGSDYLLLSGNPILIGLATSVAFKHTRKVQFLQWAQYSAEREGKPGYLMVAITAD